MNYAFVEMRTPELATSAIAKLDKQELGGHSLKVGWPSPTTFAVLNTKDSMMAYIMFPHCVVQLVKKQIVTPGTGYR